VKSVRRGKAIWNANGGFVSVLLTHLSETISTSFFSCRNSIDMEIVLSEINEEVSNGNIQPE